MDTGIYQKHLTPVTFKMRNNTSYPSFTWQEMRVRCFFRILNVTGVQCFWVIPVFCSGKCGKYLVEYFIFSKIHFISQRWLLFVQTVFFQCCHITIKWAQIRGKKGFAMSTHTPNFLLAHLFTCYVHESLDTCWMLSAAQTPNTIPKTNDGCTRYWKWYKYTHKKK